ncbi:peptidylprolyl isomerase [Phenylobacterium sp. LjRoot225]|uniref:peptidylprolyl isomerase n=1 Tax=Phenylobacterium sp. LjRoot225 TaxID=3342285 RepID=UPI003ED0A6C1
MTADTLEPRPDVRRPPGAISSRIRAGSERLIREPLVHFFAAGLVLFAAYEHHRADTDLYRIEVTPQRVAQLVAGYRAEFGGEPSPQRVNQLVDRYVDDEVLYREGLARKLDRDDEIVRRRVVQKMQFLQQDLAAPAEPTESELAAYYRAHRADYVAPAAVGFSHIFFADGAGGSEIARRRALAVLASLSDAATRAPDRGDSFPDLYDYSGFSPDAARRLFGDSELSRRLFALPPGRWAGPFRSSYGWHLVRVQTVEPAKIPAFDAVRPRVRDAMVASRQAAANRESFQALRARFTVVRDGPVR